MKRKILKFIPGDIYWWTETNNDNNNNEKHHFVILSLIDKWEEFEVYEFFSNEKKEYPLSWFIEHPKNWGKL